MSRNILGGTLGDAMGCHIYPCLSSSVSIPTSTIPLPSLYDWGSIASAPAGVTGPVAATLNSGRVTRTAPSTTEERRPPVFGNI